MKDEDRAWKVIHDLGGEDSLYILVNACVFRYKPYYVEFEFGFDHKWLCKIQHISFYPQLKVHLRRLPLSSSSRNSERFLCHGSKEVQTTVERYTGLSLTFN